MLGKSARRLLLLLCLGAGVLTCDCGAAQSTTPSTAQNAADIGLVGTTAGVLTITTVEPEFEWPILLRRNDKRPGPKTFRIESSLLVGPGGLISEVFVDFAAVDFPSIDRGHHVATTALAVAGCQLQHEKHAQEAETGFDQMNTFQVFLRGN